jgi:Molecular chaperone (small heat shock protein)
MPELLHLEDLEMRIDLSPYRRSTVGFDRLFNLLETGNVADAAEGYPPFDIVRDGDDSYRITLAVAGFRPDEIEIVAQQNQLSVSGKKADEKQDAQYIHRGIATRSFDRRFQLADFVEVRGANFQDGLLSISLQRVVPEAMKPRKIEIGGTSSQEQIEHRDAA